MTIKFPVDEDRPFFSSPFWPIGVPHQLDINFSLSIADMLQQSVQKYPNDPAIWFLDTFVTYRELAEYVSRMRVMLHSMGVKKGEVVSLYLPNCIQYVVSYYAITSLGGIVSGINPTYKPMEILHQLETTQSTKLIVLDALYEQNIPQLLSLWQIDWVIYTNILDLAYGMHPIKRKLGQWLKKIPTGIVIHPRSVPFLSCIAEKNKDIVVPPVKINPEIDTAVLIMTGGTTGVPKAAELTHENVVSNAKQAEIFISCHLDPSSKIHLGHGSGLLGVIPLFHSYAHTIVMNAVISCGAWMILFPKPPTSKELVMTLHKLPNHNYFGYAGVEILFQRIAELPVKFLTKYPLENLLKLNLSGAGPLHDYVRKRFEAATKTRIVETYGLTEASPGVSINNIYGNRDLGTIGCPLPGTDWAIFPLMDSSPEPLIGIGKDAVGELCISGPQVMKGYYLNSEQTASTIFQYGGRRWLKTGDVGYMAEDGRMVLLDRKKQLIKMAGHSVFPAEVENIIGKHPAIIEVAVAGLPDPKTGEAVKAWVALKPSSEVVKTISENELKLWCKENMAYWKVPKYIEIVSSIPKNIIGKVMRRELQEKDPLFQSNNDK